MVCIGGGGGEGGVVRGFRGCRGTDEGRENKEVGKGSKFVPIILVY